MIREAVARYINAWASVLEARAQKVRCPHRWEQVTALKTWGTFNSNGDAIVRVELYVCTSCGEHKKITMP